MHANITTSGTYSRPFINDIVTEIHSSIKLFADDAGE
jgi:hypothetical protein